MKETMIPHTSARHSGFRVPDGYFESLTQRVMERLPEAEAETAQASAEIITLAEPTLWQRVRPWLYMAAMFVGAAFIIRIASPSADEKAAALAHEEAESQEIEYIENALDAAMMDDYSLYMYLAEDTNH